MTDGTPREQDEVATEVPRAEQDPTAAGDTITAGTAAERLRLETALLEAQQEIRERRLALDVIRNELARTQQDLDAERAQHKEDAERFREDLAHLRALADEAAAQEQHATRELSARLGESEDAIAELREELESSQAQLGLAHTETGDLRAELQEAREQSATAVGAFAGARDAALEARADAERLLERLRSLADELG